MYSCIISTFEGGLKAKYGTQEKLRRICIFKSRNPVRDSTVFLSRDLHVAVLCRVPSKKRKSGTTEADPLWLVNHDGLHSLQFTSIESAQGKILLCNLGQKERSNVIRVLNGMRRK